MLFGLYHMVSHTSASSSSSSLLSPSKSFWDFFWIAYIIHIARIVYAFDLLFWISLDLLLDQLTKTFICISNPPWNKGDGLYLSDKTFLHIMTPLSNVSHIYLFNSQRICLTSARPIFPGILAEPEIANLS